MSTAEDDQSKAWRRNELLSQWELGYYDEQYQRWVIGSIVSDEFIDRVMHPAWAAWALYERVGSVPPPMEKHLPGWEEQDEPNERPA